MKMSFNSTAEFQKDFKKLSKKFKTLNSDLAELKKVLDEVPLGIGRHFYIITQTEVFYVLKARLFCRYLRGSSLRVVYVYFEQEQRIEFIELYFKGNKGNENRERIKEYLKNQKN
ncbi:MAG: hypothetical protein U9Q72_03760 [Patescibacteria group bacterium]|nr:hypothetical protein [Patescibacteria group bacterium]